MWFEEQYNQQQNTRLQSEKQERERVMDEKLWSTFGVRLSELTPAFPGVETDDGCDHYFHRINGMHYYYTIFGGEDLENLTSQWKRDHQIPGAQAEACPSS